MKYKDRFIWEDPEFSIGRFYNSDIRKICALTQYYKYMFPDSDEDPREIQTARVRNPNCVYVSVRKRNKVIAYGAYDFMGGEGSWLVHQWKKRIRLKMGDWHSYGKLGLAFGFEYLKARKIYSNIPVVMTDFIEKAKGIGFKEEGISREAVFYDGEPHDLCLLSCLRKEWL